MGTMVDTLLPLYRTVPAVLAVEGTRVDSAKGAERNGREGMFGPLQGTRQHVFGPLHWSKGRDGHLHVLSGPRVERFRRSISNVEPKQEWKYGKLWNLLKGFSSRAGTTKRCQIKDPTPVVPSFRTPPRWVFGLHVGAYHSVGLEPQPLQNNQSLMEPTPAEVVPTFKTPSCLHDG
ncbi:unnamed protein product [Urochloa decumbens]